MQDYFNIIKLGTMLLPLCLIFNLTAQNTFNHQIKLEDGIGESGDNILSVEDGFVIAGTMRVGNSVAVSVIKTDLNGEVIWNYYLTDDPFDYYTFFEGGIIEEEGGYVILGTYEEEDIPIYGYDGFLLKLNYDGELEWFSTYNDPGPIYFRHLIKKGSDYYIMGKENTNKEYEDLITDQGNPFVLKLDSNRNVVWRKDYAVPNTDIDYLYHFYEDWDGGFVMDGGVRVTLHDHEYLSRFIKIDSSGTELWDTILYEGDGFCDYGLMIPTKDRGYLYRDCNDSSYLETCWTFRFPELIKLNKDRKVEWQLQFVGYQGLHYFITKIIELPNGDFVGFGLDVQEPDLYESLASRTNWVFKVSKDGKLLWDKHYMFSEIGYPHFIYDMDYVPSDGGFIFTGYVNAINTEGAGNVWLLKLDSLGCLDSENCGRFHYIDEKDSIIVFEHAYEGDCVLSMYEEEVIPGLGEFFAQGQFKIVPNPSNGSFELILDDAQIPIQTIKIFNGLGACVYSAKNPGSHRIELQNVVSGIYFIEIILKDKSRFIEKLVVK